MRWGVHTQWKTPNKQETILSWVVSGEAVVIVVRVVALTPVTVCKIDYARQSVFGSHQRAQITFDIGTRRKRKRQCYLGEAVVVIVVVELTPAWGLERFDHKIDQRWWNTHTRRNRHKESYRRLLVSLARLLWSLWLLRWRLHVRYIICVNLQRHDSVEMRWDTHTPKKRHRHGYL